jgi:hypothetical protein
MTFEWLEDGSTETTGTEVSDDNTNPVDFGECRKGVASYPESVLFRRLNLWHDRNGAESEDIATDLTITVVAESNDDEHPLFVGTDLNGGLSCIEVRSTDGYNCIADVQEEWTRISPDEALSIGDMPSNSMRVIEIRVVIPADMESLDVEGFDLQINS